MIRVHGDTDKEVYIIAELYHHGVKGQKWGVRRYQPYPKGKHGTFLGQDRDNDIRIKAGTVTYRAQSSADVIGNGQTYVSFSPNDHLKYLAVASTGDGGVAMDMSMQNGNDGRPYSVKLKLTNDIIAPSYQATMDAFVDTVEQMGGAKKFATNMTGPTSTNYDKQYTKQETKDFVKKYKKLTVDEMRDSAYEQFTKHFMKNTDARSKFFSILKSQGYNAIVDENDKKFGRYGDGYGEAPMIIFDKSKDLKKISARGVSDKDERYFQDYEYDPEYANKRFSSVYTEWKKYLKS